MASKSKIDLVNVAHVAELTCIDVQNVLLSLGFLGRQKGRSRETTTSLTVNRVALSRPLESSPIEKLEAIGSCRYSYFHVQWHLWQFYSDCVGAALKKRTDTYFTDDFYRCEASLREVASAAGADVQELSSGVGSGGGGTGI